jgi:hypothetical protein
MFLKVDKVEGLWSIKKSQFEKRLCQKQICFSPHPRIPTYCTRPFLTRVCAASFLLRVRREKRWGSPANPSCRTPPYCNAWTDKPEKEILRRTPAKFLPCRTLTDVWRVADFEIRRAGLAPLEWIHGRASTLARLDSIPSSRVPELLSSQSLRVCLAPWRTLAWPESGARPA